MKNLIISTALTATLALSSTSVFAEIADGSTMLGTLNGNGCIVGDGEYGASTFTFTDTVVSHGLKNDGDEITQTATIALVGDTLPAACDGIEVMVSVVPVALVNAENNISDDSFTTDAPLVATKFSSLNVIQVEWKGTVSSTNNDLGEEFTYSKAFTVSVTAVPAI